MRILVVRRPGTELVLFKDDERNPDCLGSAVWSTVCVCFGGGGHELSLAGPTQWAAGFCFPQC
jgi:hypothetical protein